MNNEKDRHPSQRFERDPLGEVSVPADALWGAHTARAIDNFSLSRRPVHSALVRAFGYVKLACARTNREIGCWSSDSAKTVHMELT